MEAKEARKVLKEALDTLYPNFTAIQIVACWESNDAEDSSQMTWHGIGNQYAREGMMRTYLKIIEQRDLADNIGDALNSAEDEGDQSWRE